MPSNNTTFTAAKAVIKITDAATGELVTVGKIKDIRVTENYSRGNVQGLGELSPTEKPVLSFNGTFTMSAYKIDPSKFGNVANPFINRSGGLAPLKNTLILDEKGVDIYIYAKEIVEQTAGLVTQTGEKEWAILRNCFIESDSWSVTEADTSSGDVSGTFLNPVFYSD